MRRSHPTPALLAAVLLACACTAPPSGAAETGDPVERARALAAAGEVGPAVESLAAAVERGDATPAALLASADFEPLRGEPAFRELICDHAAGARLHVAPEGEPGEPLRLAGRVVDAAGLPVAGARVYAFQTDARGIYSPSSWDGGRGRDDNRNPRLFACGVSDAEGGLELVSVLPASYPDSSIQRHIHYRVEADGHPPLVGEVLFADDEKLSERGRASAERRGWPVVDAPAGDDGVRRGEFVLRLGG